jgi:DtxR family Mn-dependent transcriptional regulator
MVSKLASENYLKEIYELGLEESPVKTSRLAGELGVSPAAVTEMVKRLEGQQLVSYRRYRGVELTALGRRRALAVLRRHRLWELFLYKVLELPWSEVHEHAHRLEHATDERLADALDEFLGHPRVDPHGAPIPDARGVVAAEEGVRLTELAPGCEVTLLRCVDETPELLEYLGSLGLVPGTRVVVGATAPFGGPLTIEVGTRSIQLGQEAARTLLVTACEG